MKCSIRSAFVVFTGLFAAACAFAQGQQVAQKRTNILFFLVDDMGWQDCSLAMHTERTKLNDRYQTPNLEKLATMGTVFTQAYTASVCSPSRTSLMTGQNAARHGITSWTLYKDKAAENGRVINGVHPPAWPVNGLCPDATVKRSVVCTQTLPRLLSDAGYHCIHVGKAHWGAQETSGADPLNFGFAVNIGGHCAGGPGSYHGEKNYSGRWRNAETVWDVPGLDRYHGTDTYLTEALTLEAMAALDCNEKSGKPFYLYMSHYAVHAPFEADPRYVSKYRERGLSDHDATYASMLEGMDKSLGDLMAWLERNHHLDDTLVIFMSDNGSPRENARNLPLRGHKVTGYEGGTRVPFVIRLPRQLKAGRKVLARQDAPIIIEDVYPSLLDVAGVPWRKIVKHTVDGQSFMPLVLEGSKGDSKREFIWHYPNTYDIGPWSSIRLGDWKLICHYAERKLELYNLKEDIGESRNILSSNREIAKDLAMRLGSQLKARKAFMPQDSKGKTVGYPEDFLGTR